MPQLKGAISRQLTIARIAISNSLADEEIQSLVAVFGYTPDKLGEGQQLYDTAVEAMHAHSAAMASQKHATALVRASATRAQMAYQRLSQLARALFHENSAELRALEVDGRMPRSAAAFLHSATTLFTNARKVEAIQTKLAEYGYDAMRLLAEQATVAAFDQAHQAQIVALAATKQAMAEQSAALSKLYVWNKQYYAVAKIALADKPLLLKKIGSGLRTQRPARRSKKATKPVAPADAPDVPPATVG